ISCAGRIRLARVRLPDSGNGPSAPDGAGRPESEPLPRVLAMAGLLPEQKPILTRSPSAGGRRRRQIRGLNPPPALTPLRCLPELWLSEGSLNWFLNLILWRG